MKTIAAMATMPSRRSSMPTVVHRLARQVDQVLVWANGYTRVPSPLRHVPNLRFICAGDVDLGGAGKFAFLDGCDADYYVTWDDDFAPDVGTIPRMLETSGRHGGATVTYHGHRFPLRPVTSYRERLAYSALGEVPEDTVVEVGGTGVMVHDRRRLRLTLDDFHAGCLNDIEFAYHSRDRGVPIVVLAHRSNELRYFKPTAGDDIYSSVTQPRMQLCGQLTEQALCGVYPRVDEPIFKPLTPELRRRAAELLADTRRSLAGQAART